MFLRHLVHWPSVDVQVKFYGDRLRGITPPTVDRWPASLLRQPFLSWIFKLDHQLQNLVCSWPGSNNYLWKFRLKSFQWFMTWAIEFTIGLFLWPLLPNRDLWIHDFWNAIGVMWTWYWVTEMSFIKHTHAFRIVFKDRQHSGTFFSPCVHQIHSDTYAPHVRHLRSSTIDLLS